MLNSEDIKAVKDLIAYKNESTEKIYKFWRLGNPTLINKKDIFASNAKIFEFVRSDNEYLCTHFKNKLLRKLAKEMFNNCEITADEHLTYNSMFDPIVY